MSDMEHVEWKKIPIEGLPHQYGPILVTNGQNQWVAECFHHYNGEIDYEILGMTGYDAYNEDGYENPTHYMILPSFPEVSDGE